LTSRRKARRIASGGRGMHTTDMPTLILMRHAKAVREHEAASDRARGLTGRGRREAGDAVEAMRVQGFAPRAVRVSSAVRTVETAAIVAGVVAPAVEGRFVDRLYLAAAETIWDDAMRALSALDGPDPSALVVGHNPGMQELVAALVMRSGDRSALARAFLADLPTAAWAAFAVDDGDLRSTGAKLVGGWRPPRDA
jgi:phosphohistidine phosphatase